MPSKPLNLLYQHYFVLQQMHGAYLISDSESSSHWGFWSFSGSSHTSPFLLVVRRDFYICVNESRTDRAALRHLGNLHRQGAGLPSASGNHSSKFLRGEELLSCHLYNTSFRGH